MNMLDFKEQLQLFFFCFPKVQGGYQNQAGLAGKTAVT